MPRPDNLGFAAGVNLAAARTRSPYLLLLNPDTVTETPFIRVLESWLAGHPDVGVAGARVLNSNGSVQPSARRFPPSPLRDRLRTGSDASSRPEPDRAG